VANLIIRSTSLGLPTFGAMKFRGPSGRAYFRDDRIAALVVEIDDCDRRTLAREGPGRRGANSRVGTGDQ
jgi:hypothetical protein